MRGASNDGIMTTHIYAGIFGDIAALPDRQEFEPASRKPLTLFLPRLFAAHARTIALIPARRLPKCAKAWRCISSPIRDIPSPRAGYAPKCVPTSNASPDRLLHPLCRVGPEGSEQWERITWDDAINGIATRWKAIIAEYGAAAILPLGIWSSSKTHAVDASCALL